MPVLSSLLSTFKQLKCLRSQTQGKHQVSQIRRLDQISYLYLLGASFYYYSTLTFARVLTFNSLNKTLFKAKYIRYKYMLIITNVKKKGTSQSFSVKKIENILWKISYTAVKLKSEDCNFKLFIIKFHDLRNHKAYRKILCSFFSFKLIQ